jgi:uncharacterized protein (TIGR03437 family)
MVNYQDPSKGPAVACVSSDPNAGFGTVLTDANGNATCTLLFGGQPGNGQFVPTVGSVPSATATPAGFWQPSPVDDTNPTPVQASWFGPVLREVVSPGAAQTIKITSGNNQTTNAGTTLQPLQVEVDDASGKPLSGIAVNWTATPSNLVNISAPSGTTDFGGKASPGTVILSGSATGTIQIKAALADPTKSVTFTINVGQVTPPVTITGFTIVSGNNQSALMNTAFAQPLVVKVTTSNGAPSGVTVQFSATSAVFLSSTTATTDANGNAQINVTAGSATGAATVTASVPGQASQTFSLTVTSTPVAPVVSASNFVNGADLQANSLSPCGIGALVTTAGALGVTAVGPTFPGLPVPNTNVKLTIGNVGAPILSVGTTAIGQQQINFQVPCEVTPGSSVPATLAVGSGTTNVNLNIGAASPGIFQTLMSDGQYRAVIVRPDGSYVSLQNPARRGETVEAYVTGLGPTSPSVGTLSLPQPPVSLNSPTGTVIVGMAGRGVPLLYSLLSEDLPGVFVVTFQIPSDMTTGNDVTFSMSVVVNGNTFNSGLSHIPVQ